MTTKMKSWVNLILLLATLFVNFLGGTGRINDMSQGEVSDMYNTLITPAGFTFSIWSLIYGLLIISMVVMIIKHEESYYREAIDRISLYLWLSFITNIVWIILFSYLQIGFSTIFIFAYLFSLVFILGELKEISRDRQWLLPLTFGLNTGWLFIASVVNVASFLVQLGWDGMGISEANWAAIMMVVAVGLTAVVVMILKNPAFPLPIAWAFFGIYRALQAKGDYNLLEMICLVAIGLLVLLSALIFVRNDKAFYPRREG